MHQNILDDFAPQSPQKLLKEALRPHLGKNEAIVWAARPKQGILLTQSDGCLFPFSLVWAGFAIFWEVVAITYDTGIVMILFGLPFVLLGLYMLIGRFIHDLFIRQKLIYGLTPKRIIIKRGDHVKYTPLSIIADIAVTEKKNGSGSLLFTLKKGYFNTTNAFLPSLENRFNSIPNVRVAHQAILQLQKNLDKD